MASSKKKTSFMDLPLEIRTIVYTDLFRDRVYQVVYHKRMQGFRPTYRRASFNSFALLQTSRGLRSEVMPIFLQEGTLSILTQDTANWEFKGRPVLPDNHCLLSLRKVNFVPSLRGYTAPLPLFKTLSQMTRLELVVPGYSVSHVTLSSSTHDIGEVLHSSELRKTALKIDRGNGSGYYHYSGRQHRHRETHAALYWAKSRGVQVLRVYGLKARNQAQEIIATGNAMLDAKTNKLACEIDGATFEVENITFR